MLFAGCYERFIFGFNSPTDVDNVQSETLERKNTFAAHKSTVKCVATAGRYLVSGGADDTIHLYDFKKDKDMGFLMNPGEGAVPCVQFFTPPASPTATPTHLFSGSADGTIAVWKAGGGWEHLKTLKGGHSGSVNSIAVHPSGRLALSVARDSAICMWDLMKGKYSYSTRLDVEGDTLQFTSTGESYFLVCGRKVTMHNTSGEGNVVATMSLPSRVLSVLSQHDDVLLTGLEDGTVQLWDFRAPLTSGAQATMNSAHSSRVRGMAAVRSGTGNVAEVLATASSDGFVKIWDTRMFGSKNGAAPTCVAQADTRARITCLCASALDGLANRPKPPKASKKKKKEGAAAAAKPDGASATAATAAAVSLPVKGGKGSKGSPGSAPAQAAAAAGAAVSLPGKRKKDKKDKKDKKGKKGGKGVPGSGTPGKGTPGSGTSGSAPPAAAAAAGKGAPGSGHAKAAAAGAATGKGGKGEPSNAPAKATSAVAVAPAKAAPAPGKAKSGTPVKVTGQVADQPDSKGKRKRKASQQQGGKGSASVAAKPGSSPAGAGGGGGGGSKALRALLEDGGAGASKGQGAALGGGAGKKRKAGGQQPQQEGYFPKKKLKTGRK